MQYYYLMALPSFDRCKIILHGEFERIIKIKYKIYDIVQILQY